MAHPRKQFKCNTCGVDASIDIYRARQRKVLLCGACMRAASGYLPRTRFIGQRYGKLVVTALSKDVKNVLCLCDCGATPEVMTHNLTTGHTTSCGCWRVEQTSLAKTKHGLSKSRHVLYNIWESMRGRCFNLDDADYGGRGIVVCDGWADAMSFVRWATAAGYEPGLTLERIDNDGPYEPDNCRWATRHEQARNKRNNRWYTIGGERKLLIDWCAHYGNVVKPLTARYRILEAGWEPELAVSVPPHGG